jgi:DNA invertase Pin-like site-specific DNA recombinase
VYTSAGHKSSMPPRKCPPEATAAIRVAGYIRVSTAEQAESGAGLAAQRTAIMSEIDRRGWVLHDIYVDAGVSGKSMVGREGLDSALTAIESGSADALVVAKLDRLSRSLLDFAALMARAQAKRWNLVALDLGIDLSTPAGEFLASVMASAAQWERRIIGQRTREGLAAKRAAGVVLGRPRTLPVGVVARITTDRAEGASMSEIARRLNADKVATGQGGVRWYPSTIRAVLARAESRQTVIS